VEKADVLAHVMMIVQRTVQIIVLIYVKAQQKLLAEVVDVLLTVQVDVQKDALLLVVVDVQMAVAMLALVAALEAAVVLVQKVV